MSTMKLRVSRPATPTYFRDVSAFCLVVDLGSVTAAAKALGETKGSISRRLSRLERDLGVALMRRSTRQVLPTEFGISYRRLAYPALQIFEDATNAVQMTSGPEGLLRVATSEGFGISVLAPAIADFTAQYPKIHVEIILTLSPNFSSHQIDMAIQPASSMRDSSLLVRKLIDWRRKFVASPAYLAGHPAPRVPRDLPKHRLLFSRGLERMSLVAVRRGAKALGDAIPIQTSVLSNGTAFAREAVLAGGGIGFLPSIVIDNDLRQGRLIELFANDNFPGNEGAMYLFYPAMRFVPSKVSLIAILPRFTRRETFP